MRIERDSIVITMSRGEAVRIADDLNSIANHLARLFAEVGDIDTGHALAELHSAAYRMDDFRMQIEGLRNER